jgi:hypothetical protein
MIVMADSGLYNYVNFRMAVDAGADALFRVGANLDLPALEWFPDGSYLSYVADSAEKARNNHRLRHGLVKLTDMPGIYVRAVDYEVTDRGDGGEIITLVTNVTDPDDQFHETLPLLDLNLTGHAENPRGWMATRIETASAEARTGRRAHTEHPVRHVWPLRTLERSHRP